MKTQQTKDMEQALIRDALRNWLNDPILGDIRQVAVMVGFIYN